MSFYSLHLNLCDFYIGDNHLFILFVSQSNQCSETLICHCRWPNELGRMSFVPLGPKVPGFNPRGGQLDSGFHPQLIDTVSTSLAVKVRASDST